MSETTIVIALHMVLAEIVIWFAVQKITPKRRKEMNGAFAIVTVWTASILTRGVIEYIKDPPEKGDARSNPAVIVACTSLATFLGDILLVFEAGEYCYKIGHDTKDAIKRFINELRWNPYPRGR